jgi:hypothetical protein
MNRQKLLAALAGWLALPALASAQIEIPRIPDDPNVPRIGTQVPSRLPAVSPDFKTSVVKDTPAEKPSPASEIVPPKKADGPPTVTIEQAPFDPRWMRRRAHVLADDSAAPAPTIALTTAPTESFCAWVTPEYLIWRTSSMHVPALVTSSPVGTSAGRTGVIGDSSTSILFGDAHLLGDFRSGLRLRGGFWLENTQTLGVDAGFFYLGQKTREATYVGGGSPGIARPFFDVGANANSSEPIAFATQNSDGSTTTVLNGTIVPRLTTDLWGADVNLRRFLWESEGFRVDGLIGYRYQRLRDTLENSSNSTVDSNSTLPNISNGSVIIIRDFFYTTNNFHGGQLALDGQWSRGNFTANLFGKIALGVTETEVRISGLTSIATSSTATPTVFTGGLLAQPTNIGRYRSNTFSVIPEIGLNLGYQLTPHLRLFAGYSVMYWSHVARAGDQVDLFVNTSQVPRGQSSTTLVGADRPAFIQKDTGFWAQGANIGLEVRW